MLEIHGGCGSQQSLGPPTICSVSTSTFRFAGSPGASAHECEEVISPHHQMVNNVCLNEVTLTVSKPFHTMRKFANDDE
jgi:hypothetical protein